MEAFPKRVLYLTFPWKLLLCVLFLHCVSVSLIVCANSSYFPTVCVSTSDFKPLFLNPYNKIEKCALNENRSVNRNQSRLTSMIFKQIEFTCKAPFPIEWTFATPLMDEKPLKSITIRKSRKKITGDNMSNSVLLYESQLTVNWVYSAFSFKFACKQIGGALDVNNGNKNQREDRDDITDLSVYRFQYLTTPHPTKMMHWKTFVAAVMKDYYSLHLTMGNKHEQFIPKKTQQCNYRLDSGKLPETKSPYVCRDIKNGNNFSAQFAECLSLDECNAIFKIDAYDCTPQNTPPTNLVCDEWDMGALCEIPDENRIRGSGHGIITCDPDTSDSLSVTVVLYYYFRTWKNTVIFPVNVKDFSVYLNVWKNRIIHFRHKEQIYANERTVFTCMAPSFLFANGFLWSYQLTDDTSIEIGYGSESLDENLQIVSKIPFEVPETPILKSVTCHAPLSNSHLWVNVTQTFTVKHESKPKILDLKQSIKTIGEGVHIFTIICEAEGPNVKFVWMMNMDKVNLTAYADATKTLGGSLLKCTNISGCINIVSTENRSELTLEDTYDQERNWKITTAIITCIAKNHGGEVKRSTNFYRTSSLREYIIAGSIGGLVSVVIFALCFIRFRRKYGNLKQLTEAEVNEFLTGEPSSKDPYLLPYNTNYEIPLDKFTIENTVLGEGQSATVKIGKYGSKIVAVKTSNSNADKEVFKALLTELKVLSYVGTHDNIVTFIGACIEKIRKREIYILLEFCSNGSLLEYIRGYRESFIDRYQLDEYRNSFIMYQNGVNKTLSTKALLLWASQIADGCGFLSSRKIIHGDLAARNIFLTDSLTAKVGDFGLSKQIMQYSVYTRNNNCPLPLKWIAIESLQNLEFSLQSDIWSYGIILWEIFTLGDVPYPGIDWNFESYKLLKSGYRMEKPSYANQKIYDIMLQCWDETPKLRPTFASLNETFLNELQTITKTH